MLELSSENIVFSPQGEKKTSPSFDEGLGDFLVRCFRLTRITTSLFAGAGKKEEIKSFSDLAAHD